MNDSRWAAVRGHEGDVAEIGEDLVVAQPVDVAHERGVLATARRAAVPFDLDGRGGLAGGRIIRGDGRASDPEQLQEEIDLVPARRQSIAELARPSLMRHSGALMRRARLEVAGRPDLVGFLPDVLEVMAGIGHGRCPGERRDERHVRVEVDPRTEGPVVPVIAGPWLIGDESDPEDFARRRANAAVARSRWQATGASARRGSDRPGP
jgi:hypothetical protein